MSSGVELGKDFLLKSESIGKTYSNDFGLNITILEDITFEIPDASNGGIITLLGTFGSGKSTLLKIISGILEPSKGKIYFDQKIIPLIPEKPSSFPWLNVQQNVEFGINLSIDKRYKTDQLIELVGLTGYEDYFPNNQSLGFRFRISLARAMAINSPIILIDDCFKKMNNESRKEVHNLLKELSLNHKQNFIVASTNLTEAIQLSDKILLLSKKPGKILKEIEIDIMDKNQLNDCKSEKFTIIKNKIEEAFKSGESLTTINYSI